MILQGISQDSQRQVVTAIKRSKNGEDMFWAEIPDGHILCYINIIVPIYEVVAQRWDKRDECYNYD